MQISYLPTAAEDSKPTQNTMFYHLIAEKKFI